MHLYFIYLLFIIETLICRSTDEDDPEFIRAINESRSAQSIETQDSVATATTSKTNTNGGQRQFYVVDEERYEYPRLLLERILEHKKQNYELESQLEKLRRIVNNMNKQQLAKRLEKAVIADTIELS